MSRDQVDHSGWIISGVDRLEDGWIPSGLIALDILRVNEYHSGFQPRYVEGTGEMLSDPKMTPAHRTDDYHNRCFDLTTLQIAE